MGAISPLYATITPSPFAVPISDGSSTLNAWVTGGESYVPVTTGGEPVVLVSDGAGRLILVPFTP